MSKAKNSSSALKQGLCPGPTVLCGRTKTQTGELSISKENKAIQQELERSRKQGLAMMAKEPLTHQKASFEISVICETQHVNHH